MKTHRLLFVIFLLTFIYTGCQKEEIAFYSQNPVINFRYNIAIPYNFCDTDYIKGNEYHEIGVFIELQGKLLTTAKDFVLKTNPIPDDTMVADISLAEKYTYTALDTVFQQIFIKVKRPKKIGGKNDIYRNWLKFDVQNPNHQWKQGRADKDSCRIEVTYELFPNWQYEWDKWAWGDYCNAKYIFMLDHFGVIYNEMPRDGGDIKTAYENYKKEHGPILNDDGEEIVFP